MVEANEQKQGLSCKLNIEKKLDTALFTPVQRESISTINLSQRRSPLKKKIK